MPVVGSERAYLRTIVRPCRGCGAPAGSPCVRNALSPHSVCMARWGDAQGDFRGATQVDPYTDDKPYISRRGGRSGGT